MHVYNLCYPQVVLHVCISWQIGVVHIIISTHYILCMLRTEEL